MTDLAFAAIISWLRKHGLEARTDRRGHTVVQRRKPKRSRLTKELR